MPRVLFLGLCLNFHYFSTGVVFPQFGFDFSRRAVATTLSDFGISAAVEGLILGGYSYRGIRSSASKSACRSARIKSLDS